MGKLAITFKKVKAMLEADPKYRDSDEFLVTKFWRDEMVAMGIDIRIQVTIDFYLMYRQKKFTTESSILRARRKVSEHYPLLRGLSYKPKKKKVKEVQAEIKTLTPGMTP